MTRGSLSKADTAPMLSCMGSLKGCRHGSFRRKLTRLPPIGTVKREAAPFVSLRNDWRCVRWMVASVDGGQRGFCQPTHKMEVFHLTVYHFSSIQSGVINKNIFSRVVLEYPLDKCLSLNGSLNSFLGHPSTDN